MNTGETFVLVPFRFRKLRLVRTAGFGMIAGPALATLAVVARLTPERKLLLFDLGIGLIFAATLLVVARRMIVAEAQLRRRTAAAVLIGVTAATAALGVYAVTLSGKPLGVEQLPALVVIQTLGATGGAALGFLLGFFVSALVAGARKFFVRSLPTIDGFCIGGLTGLVGGLAVAPLPHLGAGFVATSTAACAVCGFHAAKLYASKAERRVK